MEFEGFRFLNNDVAFDNGQWRIQHSSYYSTFVCLSYLHGDKSYSYSVHTGRRTSIWHLLLLLISHQGDFNESCHYWQLDDKIISVGVNLLYHLHDHVESYNNLMNGTLNNHDELVDGLRHVTDTWLIPHVFWTHTHCKFATVNFLWKLHRDAPRNVDLSGAWRWKTVANCRKDHFPTKCWLTNHGQ